MIALIGRLNITKSWRYKMKFDESISGRCRHNELFRASMEDWNIIWEDSEDDYQGKVTFLAEYDGKYQFVEYEYGSCESCDPWLELDYDEQVYEAGKCIMLFLNKSSLLKWITMLNKTCPERANKLRKAINE